MKTYLAVSWTGETTHISAYTSSDAYGQAVSFCGDSGIKKFEYVYNLEGDDAEDYACPREVK